MDAREAEDHVYRRLSDKLQLLRHQLHQQLSSLHSEHSADMLLQNLTWHHKRPDQSDFLLHQGISVR